MRVLVVGGSGAVGGLTLPYLASTHEVIVLDLKPPLAGPWQFVEGDARDFNLVHGVASGADALVYMAMGPVTGWGEPANVRAHFDASVVGVHMALWAAASAGVRTAVVTSSMSVYGDITDSPYPDESAPAAAADFYGVTKRCGELVSEAAAREFGIDVIALRLCLPTADADFPRSGQANESTISTSGRDTAMAILAALRLRGVGYEAVAISGDCAERLVKIGKARRLMGWEPHDCT